MSTDALPFRIVRSIWRALDRVRRVLHLVLLLGFFFMLMAGFAGQRAIVPSSAALVIAPQGVLVDQLSGDPFERALARARGLQMQETLVRDLVEAIRRARDDDRIKTLVLDLDGLADAGLSKLQELGAELARFRESGKKITALGDGFTRDQYYLASYADQVYLHPMGLVVIDGYGRFVPYYKAALEKLYVDYNVWTVGEFKSFVEPITRNDMSPEDEIATRQYLDVLWGAYQDDVVAARKLSAGALQRYADEIGTLLEAVDGDMAKLALDYGLVDEIMPRDEMRKRIRALVGDRNDGDDFTGIDAGAYLAAVRAESVSLDGASKVAVVVASGTILDGVQPPGTVGGDTAARLIRSATNDGDVKALVLRVDSPGGSAFASDVILRELEVFQESARPVVVSMGSVAASGGYWISMSADEIWAAPTTLTGSIGVGATLPTIERTLDRLGVTIDGVGTTQLSGGLGVMRTLSDAWYSLVGQTVGSTYDKFIERVAMYRERDLEEIDAVARGRVWAGTDALERGLVDRLGTFDDAVRSAAQLAGLAEDDYRLQYVEQELGFPERLLLSLTSISAPVLQAVAPKEQWMAAVSRWIEAAMEPLAFVERLNDPRGVYLYCFCDTR